jgi:hypothetical protein
MYNRMQVAGELATEGSMVQFNEGPGADGCRWLRTEGLKPYGQREIALPLTWDAGNWRDDGAKDLLNYICTYVERHPKRISAGDTMRYGWCSLRFRESRSTDVGLGCLVIEELIAPLHEADERYGDGAQRAIILHTLQRYTAHRLGIERTTIADFPHRSMRATVCERINPHGGSSITMSRRSAEKQDEESYLHESRWFFGCGDATHDHDVASEIATVHIIHLVESYPHIFPYLVLPGGSRVEFGDGTTTVFRPNHPEPYFDSVERFTGLK